MRLRAVGMTFAEIAAAVGFAGPQGAHAAFARVARHPASPELRAEVCSLDAARVEALLRTALPRALAGRMPYIRACVGLIELHATLAEALHVALRERHYPGRRERRINVVIQPTVVATTTG